MSDKNALQHPGDFALDGVLLIGTSGIRKEVSNLVQEINIYENLNVPYIEGQLLLKDADGLSSELPFLGQERLLFSLRTPGHHTIDFNKYHAIVYNVRKRVHTSDRAQSVLVDFTTYDNFKNKQIKISKSFNGQISDIVQEIIKGSNFLGSHKYFTIDPTLNVRKFVIPNLTPYQAVNLLKNEAISKKENSPHYLFYENSEGYHFRSFDSLLGEQGNKIVAPKATYVFQHPNSAVNTEKENPSTAIHTILHWEVFNNTNSIINLKNGMYASTLFTHDIFNKNIQKFEFNYENDYDRRNSVNMNKKSHGPLVSLLKDDELGGKKLTQQFNQKVFVHPSGSDNLHTQGIHNNAEKWLQSSNARYLERVNNFTIKIETYGDTDIMVGDIFNVIIPVNDTVGEASARDAIDRVLSGRYVVTELHHLVQPSIQKHMMTMTVMKDSFENEPAVVQTRYKTPPMGMTDKEFKTRVFMQ